MSQPDETIAWYRVIKTNQQLAAKVVRDYTEAVPQSSPFFGLSEAEATQLLEKSAAEVDDLTVLALVSFFEQLILDHIRGLSEKIKAEQSVSTTKAFTDYAFKDIERWRFLELLKLFEADIDRSLLDSVRNLYKYRNWVAHGKRQQKSFVTDPVKTHEALSAFLNKIGKDVDSG